MSQKRQMKKAPDSSGDDPNASSLATLGMRIRKAVSEGYNVPSQPQGVRSNIQRVPLPNHMSQPPSLTNDGSTLDSSTSSLSEWDSRYNIQNTPLQVLPVAQGSKRKYENMDDLNLYKQKYGDLAFNDDF